MEYKLSKGVKKGIISALTFLFAFLAFGGIAELPLWDLVVQYIKPILGAMTVGGAITMLLNYLKLKWEVDFL
jgi:hypothetical protein